MSNQINVQFKVQDAGLGAYLADIQKKSEALNASSIKGFLDQTAKAKDNLKVLEQMISTLQRKSSIENQAHRQVISNQKDADLLANRQNFTGRKEGVFSDLKAGKVNEAAARERLTALDGSERDAQDRIKTNYKEQLSSVREQERQSKILSGLAKEQIDTIRQASKEQIKSVLSGDTKLGDIVSKASTDEEKIIARLTREGVHDAKERESKSNGPSLFGELLSINALNKLIGSASQLTSTQNGFDLIKPASATAGGIIGGAIGALLGLIAGPGGALAGGGIGSELGELFGSDIGEFESRKGLAIQENLKAMNRYRAVTGSDTTLFDTSGAGVGVTDFIKSQAEYARRLGYGANSGITTQSAIYAEKGFGISQGTSAGLIDVQRSGKENNRDLAGLISGILEKAQGNILKGGDMAFADELLTKFASMQKELLKVAENVPTGLTMDILSRFNAVGGGYSARDPRSGGYINSIQGSLSAPGSDSAKALAFRVLSQQHPNASLFDLREMMQGGLNTPNYLREMLTQVDKMGGDPLNNLSGLFNGLPLSAVRRLYNNRAGLVNSNLSVEDLKAKFPLDFQGAAEGNTTPLESNTAKISNALLKDDEATINAMTDAFKVAFTATMSGATIEMANGRMVFRRKVKQNATAANSYQSLAPASETTGWAE